MNKIEILKAMNTIILALNNEEAYFDSWILTVPDEATDEDFEYIAGDPELFTDAVKLFKELMKEYLDDGFYISDALY